MLVKAKWNVKDASGWHNAGEVFDTESDLGEAVEVLMANKPAATVEKKPEPVAEEPVKEAEKDPQKVRSTTRRKVSK